MPTDVFEDALDLRIGLLEAVAPGSPYPQLRPLGREESRSFQAVILENAFLRLTLLPGLGGRLLSIFDKRTSTEILRPIQLLDSVEGGSRGAELSAGMQVHLDGGFRPNDLGYLDYQIEEPPEAVWLAEIVGGSGLSFHLRIELPPERAEIRIEARILNRTKRLVPYNAGISLDLGSAEFDGEVAYVADRRAGLRIRSNDLQHAEYNDGRLVRSRFSAKTVLAPRQVDTWHVVLTPFSDLAGVPVVNDDVSVYFDDSVVQVQTSIALPGAKVLLGLADGQTLEAPADLYPEHILEIPLTDLAASPILLAVQDADRHDRIRTRRPTFLPLPVGGVPIAVEVDPEVASLDEAGLNRLAFSPTYRALAHLERGHRALADGDYGAADSHLESALLYNADDPLNWWAKAMAKRLGGLDEEGPELPNAHYLAPMEPALRAEAFLAQSQNQSKDANPLVAPLAEKPEQLIEIACLLLEIGLRVEASRWIDEALRHRDAAMLRYLAAWSLLQGSRMEAEAATLVRAASKLPFEAPYPWREIEIRALRDLTDRFPDEERLAQYAQLVKGK